MSYENALSDMDARIVTLESQLEQARALLWVWTDMDPLRYDNDGSACPWCAFDYSNMRHEADCAFVQARVFLGIEGGGNLARALAAYRESERPGGEV